MARKIFHPKRGWYESGGRSKDVHFVQDDSMGALTNPISGKTHDSKSAYKRDLDECSARDGQQYRIAGNDMVGKWTERRDRKPQALPYEVKKDAFEYASSVRSDPSKLRAWRNEQDERRAEYRKHGLGE